MMIQQYLPLKGRKLFALLPFTLFSLFLLPSCSDWLDVRGEDIQKEADQFRNYKGFRDALTGCYMTMGNTNIYGQKLTMTDVENLADLWYVSDDNKTTAPLKYQLSNHDYQSDEARAAIKTIYGGLFTTITSANVLLKHLAEQGGNIANPQARKLIEGEALAIRAYCQLDVLRLFGQLPTGGSTQVELPYSFTTAIEEMPTYYGFNDYVNLLRADLDKAEALLKESDPVLTKTFDALNAPGSDVDDSYQYYRQSRLNYWAVRALRARLKLYAGHSTEAHAIAMEIINAKNGNNNVITLSGINDLTNKFYALPSECLFYLSKYDVNSTANQSLIGGLSTIADDEHYYITEPMLSELYASLPNSTASHNRYLNWWNRTTRNAAGTNCPSLQKYWYDDKTAVKSLLMTKYQVIPMLRLSEVYLIAMETSTSLDEVKALYNTYMTDRQFVLYTPFESLDAAKAEIVNEYRREFFGEGQMFYTYKRHAADKMAFHNATISESNYILPLPSSEYNPNTPQK